MAKVRVVLHPGAVGELLKSEEVGQVIENAARAATTGSDLVVTRQQGRTRQNVRIADESAEGLQRETETGHLTRALGQVKL